MPTSWDVVAEKKLLLAIIDLTNPKAPQWPLVADKMGGVFSAEACRQHYQKIKRHSGEAAAASPTKVATPKTPKKGPSKRKSSAARVSTADDDTEPESASPCKKVKDEGASSGKDILFKIEEANEGIKGKPINVDNDELYD